MLPILSFHPSYSIDTCLFAYLTAIYIYTNKYIYAICSKKKACLYVSDCVAGLIHNSNCITHILRYNVSCKCFSSIVGCKQKYRFGGPNFLIDR